MGRLVRVVEGTGPGPSDSMTQAPSLTDNPRVVGHREYVIRTLLYGLTGPIEGQAIQHLRIFEAGE